jgi:peptide/nickel transport system permease protein
MSTHIVALYVIRRLAAALAVLLLISFGVFSLLYIAPGSIIQVLLGQRSADPATIAAMKHEYHLDDPFLVQYWDWLKGVAHLDLGRSIVSGQPVLDSITQRLAVTIVLGGLGFLISLVAGVVLGTLSALHKRSALDQTVVGLSVVGVSAPAFASGILLLYLFGAKLAWFPVFGAGGGVFDRIYHLALPAIALAFTATALILKLTRTAMLESLDQDYITFARARGVRPARVIARYALRNALIPVVTASGIVLAYTLTGAVLVEVTFSLPGLGSLLVSAVNAKDIPVVQGLTIVLASIILLVNLATDLVYLAVDPRIRFGRVGA